MITYDFLDRFKPDLEKIKTSQNLWEFEEYAKWISKEFNSNPWSYLEIGSYAGESLYYMAQLMPKGSTIVLVDLGDNVNARSLLLDIIVLCKKDYGHNIELINGLSNNLGTIETVKSFVKKETKRYDLCFIDANHNFEWVIQDFKNYRSLTRWLSFHDISEFNTNKTKIKYGIFQANANHFWQAVKLLLPKTNKYYGLEGKEIEETNWLEIIQEIDFSPKEEDRLVPKPRGMGILRSQW